MPDEVIEGQPEAEAPDTGQAQPPAQDVAPGETSDEGAQQTTNYEQSYRELQQKFNERDQELQHLRMKDEFVNQHPVLSNLYQQAIQSPGRMPDAPDGNGGEQEQTQDAPPANFEDAIRSAMQQVILDPDRAANDLAAQLKSNQDRIVQDLRGQFESEMAARMAPFEQEAFTREWNNTNSLADELGINLKAGTPDGDKNLMKMRQIEFAVRQQEGIPESQNVSPRELFSRAFFDDIVQAAKQGRVSAETARQAELEQDTTTRQPGAATSSPSEAHGLRSHFADAIREHNV